MGKVKEFQRGQIIKAAGNFLCDPSEGDLYDAYLELKEAQKEEQGSDYASNYVDIPESISAFNSVDQIVDLIECAVENNAEIPDVLSNVDWPTLKAQKLELLKAIEEAENKHGNPNPERAEALNGILNLIDSLQDYVVDVCGLDEKDVLNLTKEDNS